MKMTLKDLLSRPSTSASSKNRFSTFEPASTTSSPRSSKSPERGHRKIGSLQRLSLSFLPSSHDATFNHFLTDEPDEMSRKNSLAYTDGQSASRTGTTESTTGDPHKLHPSSMPVPTTPREEDEDDYQDSAEDVTPKPERLSLMKFKHASDPQLSTRFRDTESKQQGSIPPPKIIMTAPTSHLDETPPPIKKQRFLPRTFNSFRKSMIIREEGPLKPDLQLPTPDENPRDTLTRTTSDNPIWQHRHDTASPPAYGDESGSALALPVSRISESGGSEGSSGSHKLYAQTTTTHFIETTTTIFKLKKNKKRKTKDKGPLFPLPERFPRPSDSPRQSTSNLGDGSSTVGRKSMSPSRKSTQNIRWKSNLSHRDSYEDSPNASATALTNAPLGSPGPAISRQVSNVSGYSGSNTPTNSLIPPRLGARGRSSTMGSLGRSSDKVGDTTPSGRNSMSTTGRRSFGDILTQRLRKDSAPPRHGSGSGSTPGSNKNSFQQSRDVEPELVYPPREESDTPASYLEKLEAAVPRGAMATILCKSADEFSKTCLRKYMRGFHYFGESIDISIRKMLMEVILPKETQQIDRLLQSFADRYHECNPGIFLNADEANFVAFSILLLQSDNHNKNNKRKMTKQDYCKNTQNGRISVAEDVLDCFYDNISYTPFIHFDDEFAVNNHRLAAPKRKPVLRRVKSSEIIRGPVDPYALILDQKLEILRPPLKDVIETEDTYDTAPVNSIENHRAFVHAAVVQIVSARSRPDAFAHQATITNPSEAQVGLVSIKVAKVGLLWRKSTKKKKTKSPWQEWGVILTDSKLYFFRDLGWVRKLISQYEGHTKSTTKNLPLVFKPPLQSFDPDAWMSLDDAVALTDSKYNRHKNAFTFIKHGGFEEVFLANSDPDVIDWISKLNYAATFRTAGVRMRGLLGTNYEGRNIFRKDSEVSTKTDNSQTLEQPTPITGKTNPQLTWEIMFYRRQLVSEKISALDDHVGTAQKELDYLLRNARHILVLLPFQQKTREALVLAAGRMNAKLKWTRKEIWQAKVHRDILIKDLEAEAASAFPAPKASVAVGTPIKTTPTKSTLLSRSDTDQTLRSTKSPAVPSPMTAPSTRRPSATILEHIVTDNSEPPELASRRRKSGGSVAAASPLLAVQPSDEAESRGRLRTPSIRTQNSHLSMAAGSQAATDADVDGSIVPELEHVQEGDKPHDSGSEKDYRQSLSPLTDGALKERTGSVRRSLHRTLRESSGHIHIPHHTRSKKGKESGSSQAPTEDGKSVISADGEELKRDPTGRFVLHGKKASVITMGPEWQLSSEDRMRMREQMLKDNDYHSNRTSLHIDTKTIDDKRKSVERPQSVHSEEVSPGAPDELPESHVLDKSKEKLNRKSMADSNRWSVHTAVTTPARETFHSAETSPRHSSDSEDLDADVPVRKQKPTPRTHTQPSEPNDK